MCACRKGGPLAVTDANLMLGRLLPDYFPKIFGKSEREPLDVDASRVAFEEIAGEINKGLGSERQLDLDEIIYGYARFLRPSALISLTQIRTDLSRSRTRPWPDLFARSRRPEDTQPPGTCAYSTYLP